AKANDIASRIRSSISYTRCVPCGPFCVGVVRVYIINVSTLTGEVTPSGYRVKVRVTLEVHEEL
ncbi:MAG: hypothetical protein Q4C47_06620, partial [Planctomycetia bacterium]|nr:hypothetical protein [Planctomycetia bacterium]